uniref:Putative secreted protein n=1 Tax=Ixodes ricinus TaxID=34613 RepID=A0A6B0UQJ3_IXORI
MPAKLPLCIFFLAQVHQIKCFVFVHSSPHHLSFVTFWWRCGALTKRCMHGQASNLGPLQGRQARQSPRHKRACSETRVAICASAGTWARPRHKFKPSSDHDKVCPYLSSSVCRKYCPVCWQEPSATYS